MQMQCNTMIKKGAKQGCNTNSLGLESINSLHLSLNIKSNRLELAQDLLSLRDDILVAKHLVVVGEINIGVLLLELSKLTFSIVGTLTESRDLSERLLAKTQVGDLGQIDCSSSSSTSSHCGGGGGGDDGGGRGDLSSVKGGGDVGG